ncbi:MAG TPA: DNA polymerase Y family protein [Polyangiales bacterium]|nr:DNA polymerase Y family protein [Polyangiales bacterium]
MDRWACVSIPALPLQIVARSKPEWRALPTVVVSEDKPQGKVQWANAAAQKEGVLPGQSYALALSLCVGLRACVVPEDEIARVTEELKLLLWCFSPAVEVGEEAGVFWLDASGLGRLYASLVTWSHALCEKLKRLDFAACVVVGFSRFGSYALARAGRQSQVLKSAAEEQQCVEHVALARLDIEPEFRDVLSKLGIHTIASLLSLPASGLLRRFGQTAARLHALAAGEYAALRAEQWLSPLIVRYLLDTAESDSTRLLFVIKRLLAELLNKLVVRAEALASLQLRFVLDRKQGQVETEPLRPATPTLDGMLVLDLVRLRLESWQLEHAVIEVELEATGVPSSSEQLRVFAEQPRRDFAAGERAIARLRAEFGPDAVVNACLCDGHLPEACFKWQPVAAMSAAAVSGDVAESVPTEGVARTLALRPLVRRFFRKPLALSAPARELRNDGWLIRGPEAGPVTHTAGPFLMNGGWWLREVQREYQFVMTRREELYWVYQDKRRRRWFLHGLVQ